MLKQLLSVAAIAAVLAAAGCGEAGLGPQPKSQGDPKAGSTLYEYDTARPDGPMLQVLRAAQERDEELFRAAFAPEVDTSRLSKETFNKFRQKVLKGKLTPVPEAVEQVSETEAIVKMRGGKGKEIPVRVKRYGNEWKIADVQLGPKVREKNQKRKQQQADQPTGA